MTTKPRVVIVGAGTAGLAAAWSLIRNGVTDVTVLEAQDRTGGRIHTIDFGNGKIDMGAQFIHGQGNNPVYKLAKQHDLIADYAGGMSQLDAHYKFPSGENADSKIANSILRSMFLKLFMKHTLSTLGWKYDVKSSFGDYMQDDFERSIMNKSDTKEIVATKKAMMDLAHNIHKASFVCDTWQELSLAGYVDESSFSGDELGGLKQGYHSLLDVLLQDIPADCIKLSQPVLKIQWNDSNVTITTDDASFEADHVIVTTSVGFLKQKHDELFSPSIGEQKIEALKDIGYGTLGKVFLEFDEPFWEVTKTVWTLWMLWRDTDNLLELLDVAEDVEPWYRSIMCFMAPPQIPCTMVAMVGGHDGEVMESRPPHEVARVCHQLLQKFLGRSDIPPPKSVKMSRWHDNEYFYGAYSFIKVPRGPEVVDVLAEPLPSKENPRLQFAGEGTQRAHRSTVQGALMSGEREAQRILTQYRMEVKDALWKRPSTWSCTVM